MQPLTGEFIGLYCPTTRGVFNMDRIKELETRIKKARNDYYNGQASMSDKAFDALIDELTILDPKNFAVIGIGADPVSSWTKYTHQVSMGSLNKVQTASEYEAWHKSYIDKDDEVLLTLKLDGLSVSMIYEAGVLVKAATRGSGTVGELITPNVAKMIGVPLRLKQKIDVTVRGEILLTKKNHEKYFSEYSNTRNAASGISRRFDGKGCDKLSVLTYCLVSDDINFKTQEGLFESLEDLGFIVPSYVVLNTAKEVIDLKDKYQATLRDKLDFDIDGLVIHNNNIEKQDKYGMLHGKPYASIAFKFDSVAKEGCVKDIVVQVGNSGRITPVAVFSPKVALMGAEVERASLHNFSNIEELGIDIGAKVLVCRSNDVIPFVEEVTVSTGTTFKPPVVCPLCGTKTIEFGEYIQCPNSKTCPAQVVGRIKNWVKELNLLEWGDSLVERLVEAGKVTTVADLYKLSVSDLAGIDRMGQKSAQKCYDILWANNLITLDVFLGALSIPMIGGSTIRAIMDAGCDSLEKFGQLKAEHFEQVAGVGPTKAKSLADGLAANQALILDILDSGVKLKAKVFGKLTGSNISITGSTTVKRADLQKIIADNGGVFKSSVGKDCTHVIIADPNSTSSKAVSARKLGIKLISENDLFDMLK
jgi:DNA ligase (NAD+)